MDRIPDGAINAPQLAPGSVRRDPLADLEARLAALERRVDALAPPLRPADPLGDRERLLYNLTVLDVGPWICPWCRHAFTQRHTCHRGDGLVLECLGDATHMTMTVRATTSGPGAAPPPRPAGDS